MSEAEKSATLEKLSEQVMEGSVTLGAAVVTIAKRFGVDCMVEPQFFAFVALDTAWEEFEGAAKARSRVKATALKRRRGQQ